MSFDPQAIKTILLMAAATYCTRSLGLWVMNRIQVTDRIQRALSLLPGTLLVSLVAPSVLSRGVADCLAGLITIAVAWKTKSLVFSMLAGVLCVWLFRLSFEQTGI